MGISDYVWKRGREKQSDCTFFRLLVEHHRQISLETHPRLVLSLPNASVQEPDSEERTVSPLGLSLLDDLFELFQRNGICLGFTLHLDHLLQQTLEGVFGCDVDQKQERDRRGGRWRKEGG